MLRVGLLGLALGLASCGTNSTFKPKSQYPPDPWVKGYSNPDDCLGGEQLAALNFELPDYPRRAFNGGLQGWAIIRLDVSASGMPENVSVERDVPSGFFGGNARKAVENWRFEPPKDGLMQNCRVLLRYRLGTVSIGG